MGIVFRQSIKSGIVTLVGAGLGAILVAARMELLTRQDLGMLNTLISAGTILQLIVALGASTMLQTFIQRYKKDDPRHATLLTIAAIVPAAAMLVFLAAYLPLKEVLIAATKRPEDRPLIRLYYYWLPVLVLLWTYCSYLEGYLASQYKTAQSAFMREIVLRIGFLVLTILLYFNVIGVQFYIIGTILSFALQLGGLLFAATRTEGFRFSFHPGSFRKADYREMLHFSWYHLLAGGSFYIIGYFDTLLLTSRSSNGLSDTAVYSVAGFFISIFIIPYRTMVAAAYPRLNEAYIHDDKHQFSDLYNRTSLNILILSMAMGLLICLCLPDYVALFKSKYTSLIPVVLVLLAGRLVEVATGPNAEMIGLSSYYKFVFRITIGLVFVMLALDYFLIPAYGALGAAWGATISWLLFNVAKFLFAWKKLGLQPINRNTIVVLLCGISTFLSLYFIPVLLHPIADALLRAAVAMGVYGGLLLWLQPSADLQTYVRSVKERKRLF